MIPPGPHDAADRRGSLALAAPRHRPDRRALRHGGDRRPPGAARDRHRSGSFVAAGGDPRRPRGRRPDGRRDPRRGGDRVAAGQVLARLNREMLDVQLAQNAAQIARAEAAIAQAKSQIAEATASRTLAEQQLERTQQLQRTGSATNDVLDQRTTAPAPPGPRRVGDQCPRPRRADLVLARAQRRDIELRISRTEIKAKVGGTISRRTARLGALAAPPPATRSSASSPRARWSSRPTCRRRPSPARGPASPARSTRPATAPLAGRVRLVAPEVTAPPPPRPHSRHAHRSRAAAARRLRPRHRRGRPLHRVTVPLSAVMFGPKTTVPGGEGRPRRDARGGDGPALAGRMEIREGLKEGEQVVAVSGSFVRNGDRVPRSPAVQR